MMNTKDLSLIEQLGRIKLTGTVKKVTHEKFRIAAIKTNKTVGHILDVVAENLDLIDLIEKWNRK